MSDTIAALRAYALAAGSIDHPVTLVLDPALRTEIIETNAFLQRMQADAEKMRANGDLPPAEPGFLSDDKPEADGMVADVDRRIAACKELVAALEVEAARRGRALVLHFHRLAPAAYQTELDKAERAARAAAKEAAERKEKFSEEADFLRRVGDALVERCYTGASDPDGNDVGLGLDELLASVLDHADVQHLREHCIGINRSGQAVPFRQVSSGRPATS